MRLTDSQTYSELFLSLSLASYSDSRRIYSLIQSTVSCSWKYFRVQTSSVSFACFQFLRDSSRSYSKWAIERLSSLRYSIYACNLYSSLAFSVSSFLCLSLQILTVSFNYSAYMFSLLISACNFYLSLSLMAEFSLRKSISVLFSFCLAWKISTVSSNSCQLIRSFSISLSFCSSSSRNSLMSYRYSLGTGCNLNEFPSSLMIQLRLVHSDDNCKPLNLFYVEMLLTKTCDFEGTCTLANVLSFRSWYLLSAILFDVLWFQPSLGGTRFFAFLLQIIQDLVMLYSQDDYTSELTVCAIIQGQPEVADLGIWLHSMGYSSQLSISCISLMLAASEANWPNLIPCLELSKEEPRWLRQLLLYVPEAQFLSSLILFSMTRFQRIFPKMVQMDFSLHLQQSCSFSFVYFLNRAYRERSVSSCSSIHTSGCAELTSFQSGRSQRVVQKVSMMAKSCLAFSEAVQSLWVAV